MASRVETSHLGKKTFPTFLNFSLIFKPGLATFLIVSPGLMLSKQLAKAKQNIALLFHKHDNFFQYPYRCHQFYLQHAYDFG